MVQAIVERASVQFQQEPRIALLTGWISVMILRSAPLERGFYFYKILEVFSL